MSLTVTIKIRVKNVCAVITYSSNVPVSQNDRSHDELMQQILGASERRGFRCFCVQALSRQQACAVQSRCCLATNAATYREGRGGNHTVLRLGDFAEIPSLF